MTTTLLALPLAPAHAAPRGPVPSAQKAEDNLFVQLWQWLANLLGPETNATSTCSAATAGGRGCAIDPNGGGSF